MKDEMATLTSSTGEPVVLRAVSAEGRLRGLLLQMSLKQIFRNDETENTEVVYTFPLPWGAVLTGLEATLGKRRMCGQVIARTEARERYEQAIEDGDTPVMVEKSQAGVFTASLGSLKPGEEAVVEVSYAQLLQFEQGRIRLAIPTTIAPRYGDPEQQGGLLPHQVPIPQLLAEHPFTLEVTLEGQMAQGRISSPTHAVQQQRNNNEVLVTLSGKAWIDRDFVLLIEGMNSCAMAVAGADLESGEGHYALIASYYPRLPTAATNPLCLKVLVDCSGSMGGDSIKQARAALNAATQHLSEADWFSFSRFGTTTHRVIAATPATNAALKTLRKEVESIEADMGGTEMHVALKDTFTIPFPNRGTDEEVDVLLVTDGEVWDAQRMVDHARRSGHRIYAIGVGSAPAESLLREVAEATGGACEFVTPNEDMAAAVQRMLNRMHSTSPVACQIRHDYKALWQSPLPSRVALDETIHIYLRVEACPDAAPVLGLGGVLDCPVETAFVSDDLVARLVAARQVSLTAAKAKARGIAERYQLVTDHTNLLLVFDRAENEKTDGMPSLRKVHPMVAAGWGGTGRAFRSIDVLAHRGRTDFNETSATPSVWRTARLAASFDLLAASGADKFEIPAFLRREACDGSNNSKRDAANERKVARASGTTRGQESEISASAMQILAVFNDAYRHGLTFRQVLHAVTSLACASSLQGLIDGVCDEAGNRLNAWALCILAMHETAGDGKGLTEEALRLVLQHAGSIEDAKRASIKRALMLSFA